MGGGVRDPEKPIPDPGIKKAPDPATQPKAYVLSPQFLR